ncbi:bifunctional nuclease family protein [Leptolyngbyaceae cyanobacterium CCMR0082]|uniref:Bifunctional nuclease family protein n=2 Tax=Adonisia turfae TaxID=2950184 RepID=A0A6M0SHN9_9CYAN|nr:bifunctional nuclease family protein [Adonisia turfae]MDV3347498.1 bifunctional nuclease family protein [Leptothoe sp. LEGE 181152]NEZ59349.1 bifunctional nuclease family protein [Adonisia turfae CCMR0081]NEZ67481.1 bifunctional nuclease family protein [Adonisia turfae CCMR0082]
MIEMKVAGIALDAVSRNPVILLRDASERRALPIFISNEQARAIIVALENEESVRPMTHDLFANLLDDWELALDRVVIHSLKDNTFYATMTLKQGEVTKELDSRPSDAISIALRMGAPIWVMEEVIADASIPVDREADEAEKEAFRDFVSNLSPSDFAQKGRSSNQ